MQPRPVSRSHAVLVHSLGPTDANSVGFVHGGVIMKLCDEVRRSQASATEGKKPDADRTPV